jgi:hypothetical protein
VAGRNQHHLPQFLQKGFVSKTIGKDRYTWLHCKGDPPIEERIRKIGAEPFFYGNPESEVSADPAITDLENSFAKLLNSLRQGTPNVVLPDRRIPLLVTHLGIRTRSIRRVAVNAGTNLIRALERNFFPDEERFRKMLLVPENMDRILERRSPHWHTSETFREIARGMYKDQIVRNFRSTTKDRKVFCANRVTRAAFKWKSP